MTKIKDLIIIGKAIRRIRKEKGLSLIDLEISTGIAQGDLSKIETAKKNYHITTLLRIANALEVPPSRLLDEI